MHIEYYQSTTPIISSLYQFFIFLCLSLSHKTNTSSSYKSRSKYSLQITSSSFCIDFYATEYEPRKEVKQRRFRSLEEEKKGQSNEPLNRSVY
jgi:hypothetical protein